MKKLLSCVAILLSCYALQAQTLTLNNNVQGDVYFKVYAVPNSTCGPAIDYVDVMVPAYTTGMVVNLSIPSSWSSATVPVAGTYELAYALVSRDPACPGSYGWGALAGGCGTGNMYYDEVLVGDGGCSFSTMDCLVSTHTPSSCSGFACGDVVGIQFTTVALNVTIDILP